MDLIYYNGEHSAKFWKGEGNVRDSWTDWHLIPTSKPVISPPPVHTKYVEVPGTNGVIDLTTALTGWPTYGNRTGTLDYILAPGFNSWENTKAEVLSYLHGAQARLYMADDPNYFYVGTFSINTLKSDARTNGISIAYNLEPFKKEKESSIDPWLWDPFNFETGVIRSWGNMLVDGTRTITINNCVEPVRPSITATAAMVILHTYETYSGNQVTARYEIPIGTTAPLTIRPGRNVIAIQGTGSLTFNYRGGTL